MRKKKVVAAVALMTAVSMVSAPVLAVESSVAVQSRAASGWQKDSSGWWYIDEYGEYPTNCIRYIHGNLYRFDKNGYMKTGWYFDEEGYWHYFDKSGAMIVEDWKKIDGKDYYFGYKGCMLTDWVQDGYFVDSTGAWDTTPGWKRGCANFEGYKGYKAWFYIGKNNNKVSCDQWGNIDGKYYYFDYEGEMRFACIEDDYFIGLDGVCDTSPGWKNLGEDLWCYVGDDGHIVKDTEKEIDGKKYYFDWNGYMYKGIVGDTFYGNSGALDRTPGWKYIEDTMTPNHGWYYINEDGNLVKDGWQEIDGEDYYFRGKMYEGEVIDGVYVDASGKADRTMGWKHYAVYDDWFYVNEDGCAVMDSWNEIDGFSYYFDCCGRMAKSEVVDGYYVNTSGVFDKTTGWKEVYDKLFDRYLWAYVDGSGNILKNQWKTIGGKDYYFDSEGIAKQSCVYDGYLLDDTCALVSRAGWKYINYFNYRYTIYEDKWFYIRKDGKAATNSWEVINGKYYYFDNNGYLATDTYVGEYYVDENGVWRQ